MVYYFVAFRTAVESRLNYRCSFSDGQRQRSTLFARVISRVTSSRVIPLMFCSVNVPRQRTVGSTRSESSEVSEASRGGRGAAEMLEKLISYSRKTRGGDFTRNVGMRVIRFLFVRLSDAGELHATRSLMLETINSLFLVSHEFFTIFCKSRFLIKSRDSTREFSTFLVLVRGTKISYMDREAETSFVKREA